MPFAPRRPSLSSLVAVCALASAIGTLGAAVALFDAMILTPVRVDHAERLVHLGGLAHSIPGHDPEAWWSQASALEAVGLYQRRPTTLQRANDRVPATVALVSSHFFDVMQHRPAAGRLLGAQDARAEGSRAIVLSEPFALRLFGSPDAALGETFVLGGTPHTVVGVAGRQATFPRLTDAWAITDDALGAAVGNAGGSAMEWSGSGLGSVGLLAENANVETAGQQLTALLARLEAEITPRTGLRFGQVVRTLPLRDVLAREPRAAVTAFVALGVLSVCLAGLSCGLLILNEQLMRQRDWAMRQALGATPAMLKRATALKALRLAAVAGLTGSVTMYGVMSLVSAVAESSGYYVPTPAALAIGTWPVALLAAAAAGLVAALPSLWAARAPLAAILTDRRPYGPGQVPGWMVRAALVGTQACVGVGIIAAAGFATRHLVTTLSFDRGHRPIAEASVLSLHVDPSVPDALSRWDAVWRAVEGVPGLSDVAMISTLPLESAGSGFFLLAEGQRAFASRQFVRGRFDRVLGIRTTAGTSEPDPGSIVVSSALRDKLSGDRPLHAVRFDGGDREWTVTGELASVRFPGKTAQGEAATYLRLEDAAVFKAQVHAMNLLITCPTSCPPATLDNVLRAIGPYAELRGPISKLGASYERASRPEKAWALAANVYAGLTLAVVLLGVYTLAGAVVVRSAFEAGMRLALGAGRADVVARLTARVCTPASIGLAIGLALTAAIIRRFEMLPASAQIGGTLTGAAGLLLLTCTAAALLPALFLVRQPVIQLLRRD